MRAAVLEGFGGVENLVIRETADPTPGKGEVLIRVRAAGINFADVLWRLGRYPRSAHPHILGFEVAGEVVALGEGVTGVQVGQRVFGSTNKGGGYAELCTLHHKAIVPIPDTISYEEAAAIPVVFATVYHSLITFGRVAEGERVLIQAAGGGVGTVAVQWAKALGATVIATAGSDEKLARVKELGADITINYRERSVPEAVQEALGEKGQVDVVLESIGGKVLEESLAMLRQFGRLVTIGVASGHTAEIDPVRLITRNLTIAGVYLAPMPAHRIAEAILGSLQIIAAGKVKPVVGHTFPLEQVREAHALLEGRGSFGKVVLTP